MGVSRGLTHCLAAEDGLKQNPQPIRGLARTAEPQHKAAAWAMGAGSNKLVRL